MYSYRKIALLSCFVAPLALVGCGGSGSGGMAAREFTTFPAAMTKGKTTIKGSSQEVAYTADQNGVSLNPSTNTNISALMTSDSQEITAVTVDNGIEKRTWNKSNSDYEYINNDKLLVAETKDGKATIGVANPTENGFTYQTYGAWIDGNDTSGKVGAFSIGKETDVAEMAALSGGAVFKGTAAGVYANGVDDPDIMTADAELNVDFSGGTADFKTTNSTLRAGGSAAGLDMTASNMAIGNGAFSGGVSTTNGMIGTVDGRFYGTGADAAREVGGTFIVNDASAGTALGGGYGAVKQ